MLDSLPLTLPNNNDCQRLFHGRGHAFPGFEHIVIDWLPPVLFVGLFRAENDEALAQLTQYLLKTVPQATSVIVQHRYTKPVSTTVTYGSAVDELVVQENGLKYQLNLMRNQNYGLFLDMRNGRDYLRQHCQRARVLNLFAYTCAFSVAALAGDAELVVNIDIAKASLAKGRDNHRLNQQPLERVKFEGVDIFKSYGRIKKTAPYDWVVCDPPSFQQGSVNIKRDYKKIISRLPQWLKPGGHAMLCLNSPELDQQFIIDLVEEHCPDCQFISLIAPPDVYREAHAGKGLKTLLFQIKHASD